MGECLIIRSGGGTDTTNATAKSDTVVEGYTCYINDELIVGNIPKKSITKNINSSESIQLESGYYLNDNIISVTTLEDETIGTSIDSDILIGYGGWANGNKINGAMPNNSGAGSVLKVNTPYTIPSGWYSGTEKITQSLSTQPGSSVTPGSANKTVCDSNKWTTGNITIVGDSKFVPGNIRNGVNIFGKVGTFIGWADNPVVIWNDGSVNGGTLWTYFDSGNDGYWSLNGSYKIARYVVWCKNKIPGCNKVVIRATVNPTGTWGDSRKTANVYYRKAYFKGESTLLATIRTNSGSQVISFEDSTTGYSLGTLNQQSIGIFGETIGHGLCTWGITINWCAVYWV